MTSCKSRREDKDVNNCYIRLLSVKTRGQIFRDTIFGVCSCWYYVLLRAVTVAPWCSSGLAIHLVELSLRLLVVLLRRRRRLILASLCRRRRRMTAWFVAMLQLLERDITIDMLDYTSLSSSMPKSLHCKSRQVSTRHRRPNDDYAALHICAKIERRAFPIRAIRRPLSAIKHYHNEVNFVIHSA